MVPCGGGDPVARPVNRIDVSRRWLRAWARKHRVQLALTLRMTVAAVAGLGIAQALSLPLPLWTVLTALIVTQMSIGRSLKTSVDYFVGTVGGTIYGAALALLIPHNTEMTLLLVLVLAVAPVALVAALKQNLNACMSVLAAGVAGRRRFSEEDQRRIVDEASQPGASVSRTARRYGSLY